MAASTETRRLRADAARNRQALIDAARRLFTTRGLAATLDDIAVEAGVNVATAYRHFANKQELLAAFLQQRIDDMIRVAEDAAAADDPWEGLAGFFARTLELMTANRGLHDIFRPGMADEWLQQLERHVDPALASLLNRARRAGVVRRDLATGDVGMILQMLGTLSDLPLGEPGELIPRYLQIVLAGLRPTATRLPGSAPSAAQVLAATAASKAPAGHVGGRRAPRG
jgi:AcrR family transcriptional regulator